MNKVERRLADAARLAAASAGKLSLSLARHKVSPATLKACSSDLQAAAATCDRLVAELEKGDA